MEWFYAVDGTRTGPISESQLDELVRSGAINGTTLVWREGLADWTPLSSVRPVSEAESVAAPPILSDSPPSSSECAECRRLFPESEMVRLNQFWVCAKCKPQFVQRMKEGAVPDKAENWEPAKHTTIPAILRDAGYLYRRHFTTIAAVVVFVWLPLSLLSSYMDYFVFDPDDAGKSYRFYLFLDASFGIIATGAVIAIGQSWRAGREPGFASAMQTGLAAWGRMWWSNLLVTLAVVLGFVLLIIPGIILLVRLALVGPVVVCERRIGMDAMRRSFALTKDRFWQIGLLGLILSVTVMGISFVLTAPMTMWPVLNHWLFDTGASLLGNVAAAFFTLCLFNAYYRYSTDADSPEKSSAENAV